MGELVHKKPTVMWVLESDPGVRNLIKIQSAKLSVQPHVFESAGAMVTSNRSVRLPKPDLLWISVDVSFDDNRRKSPEDLAFWFHEKVPVLLVYSIQASQSPCTDLAKSIARQYGCPILATWFKPEDPNIENLRMVLASLPQAA